jgi:hypothetical protein
MLNPRSDPSMLIGNKAVFAMQPGQSTVDESPSPKTFTFNGTVVTGQGCPSGRALSFNGTSQTLEFSGTVADFAFGTGPFTIAFDIYPTVNGGCGFINLASANNLLAPLIDVLGSAGRIVIGGVDRITGLVFAVDTWQHFALTRLGDTLTARINGVTRGAANIPGVSVGASTLNGFGILGNYYVKGRISNVIIARECLYERDFTPPNRAR